MESICPSCAFGHFFRLHLGVIQGSYEDLAMLAPNRFPRNSTTCSCSAVFPAWIAVKGRNLPYVLSKGGYLQAQQKQIPAHSKAGTLETHLNACKMHLIKSVSRWKPLNCLRGLTAAAWGRKFQNGMYTLGLNQPHNFGLGGQAVFTTRCILLKRWDKTQVPRLKKVLNPSKLISSAAKVGNFLI